jgi:hypothetical protein
MTFGHGIVDGLAIIRAVCLDRRNVGIGLIKQCRYFGDVADIIGCAAVDICLHVSISVYYGYICRG